MAAMDSTDLQVLNACVRWLEQGQPCMLVTVVRTWGSSPRPVGSLLGICADGQIVGSVSGGCIEDDLIASARDQGVPERCRLMKYGISADEAHRFGLPCGGTIELVLEPLAARSRLPQLLTQLRERRVVCRTLNFASGEAELATATEADRLEYSERMLKAVFGPRWRLLIIGAGQLSVFLAQVASGLDYQVTVCDPREEYQQSWPLSAIPVVHAMPDDLVLDMRPDTRMAVVALTHDPKLDDLALMEALKSEAFYVGAIGSKVNQDKRRERLKQFDLSDAQLARLHGPVGLRLGSKTPAEIAISILAEMIAIRNGVLSPVSGSLRPVRPVDSGLQNTSSCSV